MKGVGVVAVLAAVVTAATTGQSSARVGEATEQARPSLIEAASGAATARPFSSWPVGEAPCPSGMARSGTYARDIGDARVPQSRFVNGWFRDTTADNNVGTSDLRSDIGPSSSRRTTWFHLDPMDVAVGRSTWFAFGSKGNFGIGEGKISINDRLLTPSGSSSFRGTIASITSATQTEGGELYPWVQLQAPSGQSRTWQLDNVQIFTCRSAAVDRIAGANRYATAADLSKSAFSPGLETVVVTSGESFPDALSGSALAASLGGPLLVTDSDVLSSETRDEIQRLGPRRAIVLGGPEAVGAGVVHDLDEIVPTVTRVGGETRYGTSQGAAALFPAGGHVVVATGESFPDALSGGSYAGLKSAPMLLTRSESLDAATVDALEQLDPSGITLLGGPVAVSSDVVDALGTYAPVTRIGGADRYSTSALIAAKFGGSPSRSYLTTGALFPDALAAAPVASVHGAPVLLTEPMTLPAPVDSRLRAMSESRGLVVGGTTRIGAIVQDRYGRTLP